MIETTEPCIKEIVDSFYKWQSDKFGCIIYRIKNQEKDKTHHIEIYTRDGLYIKNKMSYAAKEKIIEFINSKMG